MRFKGQDGAASPVTFRRMHAALLLALNRIDDVHVRTVGRDAICTSANDGRHGRASLHYEGRAIDLRTRDLTPQHTVDLRDALAERLGPDFDVVLEDIQEPNEHLHIEYDPDE